MSEKKIFSGPGVLGRVLTGALILFGAGSCLSASVIFQETFDRPGVNAGQSITSPLVGWVPADEENAPVAEYRIGNSNKAFEKNFLSGKAKLTSSKKEGASIFLKKIPALTSGRVTFTCQALAKGDGGVGSSVGLTSQKFSNRRVQWTCTADGWSFWVGHIDSTGFPWSDQALGKFTESQETFIAVKDEPVHLTIEVDLTKNVTWGQVEALGPDGVKIVKRTAEYQWDAALGDISGIFIALDCREGKSTLDFDNFKVEGVLRPVDTTGFTNPVYSIYQMNGKDEPIESTSDMVWISKDWPYVGAALPYMVWMPERNELLMLVSVGKNPQKAALIRSSDLGKTWSKPTMLATIVKGKLVAGLVYGMSYLGEGRLILDTDTVRYRSDDYGATWAALPGTALAVKDNLPVLNLWDPVLSLGKAADGKEKLLEAGWRRVGVWGSPDEPYAQGAVRFSEDGGVSWTEPKDVPQWLGVCEVTFVTAGNGDIVAACRRDYPKRFAVSMFDHYFGLGVSISSDKGKTWSKVNVLYDWGRHQASMIKLPNNDLVMTYVVRLGYTSDADGYPRYGVEAVVSKDNGQTWDLDHRIVLSSWTGNLKGQRSWLGGSQSTSTVLLPDGTILTAFGTGFRLTPDDPDAKLDIALVRWRLPDNKLNDDRSLRGAAFESDERNLLSPPTAKPQVK